MELKNWPVVDTAYHFWGIDEQRRYFKLFISNNADLDLSSLTQSGLPPDSGQQIRGDAAQADVNSLALPEEPDDDWTIKNIELRLLNPLPGAKINSVRNAKLPGLSVQYRNDSFSSMIRYASRNRYPTQWKKIMKSDLPGRRILPIRELTAADQLSGDLVFLEFSKLKSFELIGQNAPITIEWGSTHLLNVEARLALTNEVAGLQYLQDLKLQVWGNNLYAETTLRWQYAADPTTLQDFQIFRSAEGSAIMLYKTLPAAALTDFSFVDQDVKSKRRYFYQIMARHNDGGFSGRSEVVMVRVP